MIRESEIRENLADVLQGYMDLEEFADWLALARRNMHLDSAQEAQELASDISLLLYEYFDAYRDEADLRREFHNHLRRVVRSYRLTDTDFLPVARTAPLFTTVLREPLREIQLAL